MLSNAVLALAALGAVQGSPLVPRQASSVASSVASAASSAASSAVSAVSSTAAAATSGASSAASSVASGASSTAMMSSAASAAATTGMNMTTGNDTFPRYPCPAGTLLTYVQLNQTFLRPVTEVTGAFGEWANSSFFPNVTASTGGNEVGATHTINIAAANISIPEVLVSRTSNDTSGYQQYTWNNTEGLTAMGITLSNYSTVLQIYDPSFDQTNSIGNETIAVLFTNACLSSQAEGMTLLQTLGTLELGNLAARVTNSSMSGNMTSSTAAAASSTAMSTMSMASSMASSAASGASSAAISAVSGASSAASSAASGATSVASAVSSAVSGAVSAASTSA